jgi:hypothetical protein
MYVGSYAMYEVVSPCILYLVRYLVSRNRDEPLRVYSILNSWSVLWLVELGLAGEGGEKRGEEGKGR